MISDVRGHRWCNLRWYLVVYCLINANPLNANPDASSHSPLTLTPTTGSLLIAAPQLRDPNFKRTVIVLLEYTSRGALGVVLNRRANLTVAELLGRGAHPGAPGWAGQVAVYRGGPVEPNRISVLVDSDIAPPDTVRVLDGVYASTSMRALEWAGEHLPPKAVRVYAGYAGWGPQQLERELAHGGWYLFHGARNSTFAEPDKLWPALIEASKGTWVRDRGPKVREPIDATLDRIVLVSRKFWPMSPHEQWRHRGRR